MNIFSKLVEGQATVCCFKTK